MDRSELGSSSTRSDGAAKSSGEGSREPGMVGRVAKAIKDADWAPEFPGYEAFARAAIGAMREPTKAMCAAATPSHRTVELAPGYSERFEQLGCTPDGNWRAMIDAALSEPPRPDATGTDRGRGEP